MTLRRAEGPTPPRKRRIERRRGRARSKLPPGLQLAVPPVDTRIYDLYIVFAAFELERFLCVVRLSAPLRRSFCPARLIVRRSQFWPRAAPSSTSVATFDEAGVPVDGYGSTSPSGTFTDAGATFSGSGVVMNNGGGGSLGLYAQPYGDGTSYLAVLAGGARGTITDSQLEFSIGTLLGLGRPL